MLAVLQRVTRASVAVEGETISSINAGLLLLVGVAAGDTREDAAKLAKKSADLRMFGDVADRFSGGSSDKADRFSVSLLDTGGQALVVSQFTLLADVRKGRRPSFVAAASPDDAAPLVDAFAPTLRELGVPVEDGEVIPGDTDTTPMGWGTYGSRGTAVGGPAVALASRKLRDKGKALAAHLLEAAEEDIEYEDGKFFVRGSPDQSKTIQDIALMANMAWNMPEGMEPGFEATTFYDPPNFTYPFGTHVAVVDVDPDNGHIELQRYVAVDDCGRQINPVIVAGQVHGGVAQGTGPALWEGAVYDENGQLLTGSMLDYPVPRAHMLPDIETLSTETPSPHNPLGVKGIGETGTIASTVTVYNAVMDALKPLGVTKLDMPLTSEKVWQAIQQAKGA